MNKYIKDNKIIEANTGYIVTDEFQIFNPTEQDLIDNGWELYVPAEPTREELIKQVVDKKKEEIAAYDTSNKVNIFFCNGIPMWFNREERIIIKERFERELKKKYATTPLFYKGNRFDIDPSKGLKLLEELNTYADHCFDNTQMHYFNINELAKNEETTIEDIENYDYKAGYPNPPKFIIG